MHAHESKSQHCTKITKMHRIKMCNRYTVKRKSHLFLHRMHPLLSVFFLSFQKYSIHMQRCFYLNVVYQTYCSECYNFPSRKIYTKSFLTLSYGCIVYCINKTYLAPYWWTGFQYFAITNSTVVNNLVCTSFCMYMNISGGELEPLSSRVKGMGIFNLVAFVKLPSVGFVPAYARTKPAKCESAYFLFSSNTVYFQPF